MSTVQSQSPVIASIRGELGKQDLTYAEKQLLSAGELSSVLEQLIARALQRARLAATQCFIEAVIGLGLLFFAMPPSRQPWAWALFGGVQLVLATINGVLSSRQRADAERFKTLLHAARGAECQHH